MRIYSRERDERRVIIILYFGALVIMSFLLYTTYVSLQRSTETTRQVRRFNMALVELGDLFVRLSEEESAAYRSLLSGDTMTVHALTLDPQRVSAHRI